MKIENWKLKIYQPVSQIPKGKVVTYGQVSKVLGLRSPRIIGRVLHQNKDPKKVPCHRVVFADGSLSKSYAFGGLEKQREKLQREGVRFIRGKVDMRLSCSRS
ncbi:MGMT family protein [Candidatus Roizmanbacteria bacterium]|nr:MGMT family protein [Candidatus Roizmanbacteria bacterium]